MKRTLFIVLLSLATHIFAQHTIEEKAERAAELQRKKETIGHTIEEHTKAVEACAQKIKELQSEHFLSSTEGKVTEVQMHKPPKKAVVRVAPEGARQPYAQKGSSYKLAEN